MEQFFTCPYCWEEISMILDSYNDEEVYIEDCEVCCRPIELYVQWHGEKLVAFSAKKMEGI